MPKAVFDTDILSEYLRGRNDLLQERVSEYLKRYDRLTISTVTVFEVVRGWHRA